MKEAKRAHRPGISDEVSFRRAYKKSNAQG